MATIRHTLSHNSGIPLGGIGTGTIEVRPDGYFHEWQIFNLSFWAGPHKVGETPDWPEMRPGALSFYVRTQQEGERPLCRRLGARYDQSNLYSYAWLKNISEIEFEGRYPVATLRYGDADLPVEISAQMFSPVIPHDSRTSGTPGFQAVYRVRNRSARPVEFSLLGSLHAGDGRGYGHTREPDNGHERREPELDCGRVPGLHAGVCGDALGRKQYPLWYGARGLSA
jgi:uncharacterized protein (DUF608 family)